jgi:hypothetical protein
LKEYKRIATENDLHTGYWRLNHDSLTCANGMVEWWNNGILGGENEKMQSIPFVL